MSTIFKKGEKTQFKKMLNRRKVEKVRDHGRIETRRYTLISASNPQEFKQRWPGMQSIGMLEVKRTIDQEVEHSIRYFVTSLEHEDIDVFAQAVRKHWNVEINLHWSLDVSFREELKADAPLQTSL